MSLIQFPKRKEELKDLTDEVQGYLDSWLEKSELTKEDLIEFRNKDSIKILEEKEGNVVGIGLTYKEKGERKRIGAPLIAADPDNLIPFYQDAFLLFTAVSNILDKENKENPINRSYAGNRFTRITIDFFSPRLQSANRE